MVFVHVQLREDLGAEKSVSQLVWEYWVLPEALEEVVGLNWSLNILRQKVLRLLWASLPISEAEPSQLSPVQNHDLRLKEPDFLLQTTPVHTEGPGLKMPQNCINLQKPEMSLG